MTFEEFGSMHKKMQPDFFFFTDNATDFFFFSIISSIQKLQNNSEDNMTSTSISVHSCCIDDNAFLWGWKKKSYRLGTF